MGQNISKDTPEERLVRKIEDLERQIKEIRTNQLKTIVIPKVNGSPSPLVDGQIWYDTSSNIFKKRQNGVTKNWETA